MYEEYLKYFNRLNQQSFNVALTIIIVGRQVLAPLPWAIFLDNGEVLKKLECAQLPDMDNAEAYQTDIAVYKDTLLTTQQSSNQILVFQLNW